VIVNLEGAFVAEYKLLIGGRLVPGTGMMDIINPATEEVLAQAPRANLAQADEAVAAAKRAFPAWSATPLQERAAVLRRLADALEPRVDEFARLLTQEQGKPLSGAAAEVGGAVATLRYMAGLDLKPEILSDAGGRRVVQVRQPLGVVVAITPWNAPLSLLVVKLSSALLAGNTLVAKPAPTTPLTSLRFGEICAEYVPAGVVNIITGANELGERLTSHPDVAKITFTGSTETGKKVMASAASTLKRVTMELGGNDGAIVLDDCDINEIAPKIYAAVIRNAGQVCVAVKRLYVHDSQYDEMCEALAKLARGTVVADGLTPGVEMGPLQNRAQYERVKGFMENARAEGTIVAGGEIPERPGYFVPPTIVRDIPDSSRLVREEQFGPILPVLRYHDIEDAIARVNDTSYGLGGSVWSADIERATAVAARLNSGRVNVNKHMDFALDVPFGGAKHSGIGMEMGQEGLHAYTQLKVMVIEQRA
jgi:acyl-CoA reductase-like NAD-dependent aldehyde dehydrogenase